MIEAKDFLGKDITVGYKVVFMQRDYRKLLVGVVTKITAKTVLISHAKTNNCGTETRQEHHQVVVV